MDSAISVNDDILMSLKFRRKPVESVLLRHPAMEVTDCYIATLALEQAIYVLPRLITELQDQAAQKEGMIQIDPASDSFGHFGHDSPAVLRGKGAFPGPG